MNRLRLVCNLVFVVGLSAPVTAVTVAWKAPPGRPISHVTRDAAVELSRPTAARPESPIVFAIHVPGPLQSPVARMDEGVLNPTRPTEPDPTAFFPARRPLDHRGADIGGFLMMRVRFLPGVQAEGDDGSGLSPAVRAW